MVPDVQRDAENGKVVCCHRLHPRNDREPPDKERGYQMQWQDLFRRTQTGKFDIKNDIFKVEQSPTDSSKLVLTINSQPIGGWFKEQWEKLRQGLRKTEEPRKSRGFKL